MEETVFIDVFTLTDKYTLVFISIFFLVFNIATFLVLTSLNKSSKYCFKNKRDGFRYLTVFSLVVLFSFFVLAFPYLSEKTLNTEDVLYEGYFGESGILFKEIDGTYYPTYYDGNLSWYTVSVKDERYLEVVGAKPFTYERVDDTVYIYESEDNGLYRTDDKGYYAIAEAIKPKEYRGTEASSYWYCLVLSCYNIIIAILLYPLLSLYETKIHFMWNTQNTVSTILLSILISHVLLF